MATSAQDRFLAAVNVIKELPKDGSFQPSNEILLQFYAFYKQATVGPCNVPRPSIFDPTGRYKWNAWNKLGSMSKEDAMVNYVEELKKIVEAMPQTDQVMSFIDKLGFFYEIVDENNQPLTTHTLNGNHNGKANGNAMINGDHTTPLLTNGNGHHDEGTDFQQGHDMVDHSVIVDDVLDSEAATRPISVSIQEMKADLHMARKRTAKKNRDRALLNNNHYDGDFPAHSGMHVHQPASENSQPDLAQRKELQVQQHGQRAEGERESEVGDNAGGGENDGGSSSYVSSTEDSESEFCDTTDLYETSMPVTSSPPQKVSEPPIPAYAHTNHTHKSHPHNDKPAVVMNDGGRVTGMHNRGGGELPEGGHRGYRHTARNDGGSQRSYSSGGTGGGAGLDGSAGYRRDGGLGATSGGGGGGRGGGAPDHSSYRSDVTDTQIALALVRLQQDMSSVLNRLNTLEALTLAQHNTSARQRSRQNSEEDRSPSFWSWLFNSLRPQTIIFILTWPLVLHFALKICKRTKFKFRKIKEAK